jgi:hypothetical protein
MASKAYNILIPGVAACFLAWQLSSMHLAISWATFCASVLHMSDVAIVRIHVVTVWLIIVLSGFFILLHTIVVVVRPVRHSLRPRLLSHLVIPGYLWLLATFWATAHTTKFRGLYRYLYAPVSQQERID